jgi:hypothetical protein
LFNVIGFHHLWCRASHYCAYFVYSSTDVDIIIIAPIRLIYPTASAFPHFLILIILALALTFTVVIRLFIPSVFIIPAQVLDTGAVAVADVVPIRGNQSDRHHRLAWYRHRV